MTELNLKEKADFTKLSELLVYFKENFHSEKISLKEIIKYIGNKGFCLLLIIFALPTVIPIPYPPGLTMITGIPLTVLAIQMLCGKKVPVLPQWLLSFEIKMSLVIKIINKTLPYIYKIEKLSRPRILILTSSFGEKIIALFCLICGILIASPLLFSHSIPAFAILIMGLGFLNKDGLMILIGMITSVIGIVVVGAVFYWVIIGGKILLKKIS